MLALTPSLFGTSPGSRFRIEDWAPPLRTHGVDVHFAPFEDDALHDVIYTPGRYAAKSVHMLRALARRVRTLTEVGAFDVLFLFEEAARVGPPVLERLVAASGMPIVYDFCDPIWLPYVSQNNGLASHLKWFSKTATICRLSTQIMVGNRLLAEYAAQYNDAVNVVPITIDLDLYPDMSARAQAGGPVTVGWSGSQSTNRHLESIAPALAQLAARNDVRLRVMSSRAPELPGTPFGFVPWSQTNEINELAHFQIGLMPMTSDPWTALRSHLKVRQYMALGIPSVVSPIGIIPDLIEDGVNGFLAQSDREWVDRVQQLVDDPGLRAAMGRAARRTAEREFDMSAWVPRVAELFFKAAGVRRDGVAHA